MDHMIAFANAAAARRLTIEIERMRATANQPTRPKRIEDLFPTVLQLTPYTDDVTEDGIEPEPVS